MNSRDGSGTPGDRGTGPTRDAETRALTETIVELVGELTGRAPLALPPLADAVDPETLTRLVTGRDAGAGPLRVTFRYVGHVVSVSGDGWLAVWDPRPDEPPTG